VLLIPAPTLASRKAAMEAGSTNLLPVEAILRAQILDATSSTYRSSQYRRHMRWQEIALPAFCLVSS
jgi:hypothetical protein